MTTTYTQLLRKDSVLKTAIAKLSVKIANINWDAEHKIDPNNFHDLKDRLIDRAWENSTVYLDKKSNDKKSWRLEEVNGLPVFS